MVRLRVLVIGRVQGVGFRMVTRSLAIDHELTGWVRNEPDGSVLMEVQGSEERVGDCLEALKRRMKMNIHEMQVTSETPIGDEEAFVIRR